ncbi:RASF5 protein, partial [Amia calva]|nr:RASF5 protein [Amia calva]
AWSIFQQEDPRVREERGEGHCFAPGSVSRDWCDVCNRLVHAEALKCKRWLKKKEREERGRERKGGCDGDKERKRHTQPQGLACDGGRRGAPCANIPHHSATRPRSRVAPWRHGAPAMQIAPGGRRSSCSRAAGMTPERQVEVSSTACFGKVSKRISKLFRRLPKSRSWSEGLRLIRRSSSTNSLSFSDCSYTCHLECKDLIQLDCNQQDRQLEDTPSPGRPGPTPQHKNAAKEEEEKPKELSKDEIRAKIDDYNAKVSECVGMKLSEDGTYTGFIKVHLKLRRPVTVTGDGSDRKTSFYLPLDAVKQLHISSTTMVSEVIQGLLRKFMVLDNPRKFALYRRTHRDSQDLFQKLPVSDHPLLLRLLTGPDPEKLTFVLKENETGWHAFSVPELQNFLTILEKEERDRIKQVQQKYEAYRERLKRALHESQGKPG